jgi:hypothetical protein
MVCTKIDEKYKTSLVTAGLVCAIIALLFLVKQIGILGLVPESHTFLIPTVLLCVSYGINIWILMRDPTFTCKRVSGKCVENVLIYNIINMFIQIPISYLLLMLFTDNKSLSMAISFSLFVFQAYFMYSKYHELMSPSVLQDTILNCQSTRVIFYSIILALDLFFSYYFISSQPGKEQLAGFFNLSGDYAIIIFVLFIFLGVIYPVVIDILALDGTLTYIKPKESKLTEAQEILLQQDYTKLSRDQQEEYRKALWFGSGKKWNDRRYDPDDESLLGEL